MKSTKIKTSMRSLCLIMLLSSCSNEAFTPCRSQQIANLRAFAKLYGYVKYFHPSDEVCQIDWDKFAIYGSKRIKDAPNNKVTKTILDELFLPIAPSAQIYSANGQPEPINKPEHNNGLKVVAWQHQGVNLGSAEDIYKSIRIKREYIHSGVSRGFGGANKSLENTTENLTGVLFEQYPKVGEVINSELGEGLFCQIPLTLFSDSLKTLSFMQENKALFEELSAQLTKMKTSELTATDEFVRLGNIVIAWNVFQHFYPYFDEVETDWDKVLTNILEETLANLNEEDFYYTLRKLVAKLHDGHGRVFHKIYQPQVGFPFLVDWIEDHVVITFSKDTTRFKLGDVILQVDSLSAEHLLLKEEVYLSGSPQWKRVNALRSFGYGKYSTNAKFQILRKHQILEIQASRNHYGWLSQPRIREDIEEIKKDIYYVNLVNAEMKEIREKIDEIANAKGVIFDLRGYPKNSIHEVISYLLTEPDTSRAWMMVPQIIYPDHKQVVDYATYGWHLQPKKTHIKGKVIFIIDSRAISYAESVLGFIEHYKLAEIVGQPTAGTNGNLNSFVLPGGFRITWTGMKVVKQDGSQHHLIGILPTIHVKRTLRGIIDGRDEFFEKALEIINQL